MPRGRFAEDLVGQKFNRWTVIARTDRRAGNGGFYWEVQCECGVKGEVYTQSLTSGKSKSCGCYGRDNSKKRMTKHGTAKRGSPGYQAYVRKIHEKRKYGLTPEIKQQLLWKQHDSCAICGYEFGQKLGDYHIDHCHQTGIVRGILCDRCNRGLGYFRDTPDFLRQAASYLTHKRTRPVWRLDTVVRWWSSGALTPCPMTADWRIDDDPTLPETHCATAGSHW